MNAFYKSIYIIIISFFHIFLHFQTSYVQAQQRSYVFDGSISREVLENYLSRSITMTSLLHGRGNVDDNIRMLTNTDAKFIGRSVLFWGGESNLEKVLATAEPIAKRMHEADPEMILQGAIFEIVTEQINQVPIPAWVFEEFGMKPEKRNFNYDSIIYPDGNRVDHWRKGQSVPDMSSPETRMWFVYMAARFIDIGVEAIHFGQVGIMDDRDPDHVHWRDMLKRCRRYASKHARRHLLLCDAHVNRGIIHDGVLMFDFNSFPLRIDEMVLKPHQGYLKMDYLDSIFGHSMGGITPSGWKCDNLPYIVELDNFGASGRAGENIGAHYIWGYDEISWFSHHDKDFRDLWLHYAWNWIRAHDPNGWLQMPGSRPISPAVEGGSWYWGNTKSDACPTGFSQEEIIKEIWALDK